MGCCTSESQEKNSQRRSRKISQASKIDCSTTVSTELTLLSHQLTKKSKSYHIDHIKQIEKNTENLEKSAVKEKLKRQKTATQLQKVLRNEGLLDLATALEADLPPEMIEAAHLQSHQLHYLPDLSYFFNLKKLYLYDNKLESIMSLTYLPELVYLDLSKNGISGINNLRGLKQLQQLYLNDNKISKIENLDSLTSLKVLDLHNNRVEVLESLDELKALKNLNIKNNLIRLVQNLDGLHDLEMLDIDGNPIDHENNVQAFQKLRARKVKLNEWWLYA